MVLAFGMLDDLVSSICFCLIERLIGRGESGLYETFGTRARMHSDAASGAYLVPSHLLRYGANRMEQPIGYYQPLFFGQVFDDDSELFSAVSSEGVF